MGFIWILNLLCIRNSQQLLKLLFSGQTIKYTDLYLECNIFSFLAFKLLTYFKALCYLSGTVLIFIDVPPVNEAAITMCICWYGDNHGFVK